MHYSRLLIPTLKENPAEAEAVSHRLLLRAGLIRKLASGIYNYLPLGLRVLRIVERVVREETRRRAGSLRQEGLAHAAKGEYPEARPKLEEAVRVSGGDPGILTDLGVLYREMGMTRLAVSTFREALSKREDLAAAHAALGAIEAEAGRPFRALDHLARAVTHHRGPGSRRPGGRPTCSTG